MSEVPAASPPVPPTGAPGAPGEGAGNGARTLPGRAWLWMAAIALVCLLPVVKLVRDGGNHGASASLPVLWDLPQWSLTDQDGRAFGSEQLRGRVYVANFIFTSCVSSCPRLTRQMSQAQSRLRVLGDRVHLVSFSVDPQNDTPERLKSYGARAGADFTRWHFVTGPEDAVLRAVEQGFRVGVEAPPRSPDGTFNPILLAHSNRFALIDERGRLRGSYELEGDEGIRKLVDDVTALTRE